MNIDIDFPNVPCYLLDIGVSTSVNSMETNEILERLVFKHMDQNENAVVSMTAPNPFSDFNINDEKLSSKIKEFYDNEQYCNVEGTIEITKVTG